MKKKISLMLIVIMLVFSLAPAFVFAGSYDQVPVIFWGWSVSPNTITSGYTVAIKTLGGLDNRNNPYAANYSFSQTFSQGIQFGGSLSSQLSATVGATNGVVSGGLGGAVNSSFNIQANFNYSYTEAFSMTVPRYTKLTLLSYIKGPRITGYAKHFIAWIQDYSGTYELKIPYYQIYTPKISY